MDMHLLKWYNQWSSNPPVSTKEKFMGLAKYFVGIPVFVLSVLVAWIMYSEYKTFRFTKPIMSAEARYSAASRACMIAEAAEGSASKNDQVLIVSAMLRVAKDRNIDPCFLFSRYTLLRAPSDEAKFAWPRDPNAVELKTWLPAFESRHASATEVVDRMIAGNRALVPGEDPAIELKRRQMLECVEKYKRVWPVNTARTNEVRMTTEMGASFVSPIGAKFFCPKK